MNYGTEKEINKLTENLPAIRKVAGWSSEELGELIGVTKQTISNIETRKTKMSKTQYIAIRTIIDYEIQEKPDNVLLPQIVNVLLNNDDTEDDIRKAEQTREILNSTPRSVLGGKELVGIIGLLTGILGAFVPQLVSSAKWLKKIK